MGAEPWLEEQRQLGTWASLVSQQGGESQALMCDFSGQEEFPSGQDP